ncbi:MAG: four helix bundle protein [Planctomycetota bacterium]
MPKHQELRDRTKRLALRVIRMAAALPRQRDADIIARQVLRSGTSVAANYREASRARSDAELIAKLGIVEQELDETSLWLELLVESEIVPASRLAELLEEVDQLLRIIVTAIKTTRDRN